MSVSYTYNSSNTQLIGEENYPAYGMRIHHENTNSEQIQYSHITTPYFDPRDLYQGNVVQSFYKNRSVKTPYIIKSVEEKEPEKDVIRGDKHIPVDIQLEPLNYSATPLLVEVFVKEGLNSTGWNGPYNENTNLEYNSTYEIKNSSDSRKSLVQRSKFKHLELVSDISVADLFDIREPELLVYKI